VVFPCHENGWAPPDRHGGRGRVHFGHRVGSQLGSWRLRRGADRRHGTGRGVARRLRHRPGQRVESGVGGDGHPDRAVQPQAGHRRLAGRRPGGTGAAGGRLGLAVMYQLSGWRGCEVQYRPAESERDRSADGHRGGAVVFGPVPERLRLRAGRCPARPVRGVVVGHVVHVHHRLVDAVRLVGAERCDVRRYAQRDRRRPATGSGGVVLQRRRHLAHPSGRPSR
jgi:hypothetical protein